ncbi:hypothetical protein EYR40_009488 [Pleurotus pulmonarius]|nr:hypothetical protein EYR40_009488 [Pleurotus pulmonarius]
MILKHSAKATPTPKPAPLSHLPGRSSDVPTNNHRWSEIIPPDTALTFAVIWDPEDGLVVFSGAELLGSANYFPDSRPMSPSEPLDAQSQVITLKSLSSTHVLSETPRTLAFFRDTHRYLFAGSHSRLSLSKRARHGVRTQTSSTVGGADVYIRRSLLGRAHDGYSYLDRFEQEFEVGPFNTPSVTDIEMRYNRAFSVFAAEHHLSSRFSITTTSTSSYISVSRDEGDDDFASKTAFLKRYLFFFFGGAMLPDYDLVEQIGSSTHLATCKKGRLVGKQVILKELPVAVLYKPSDSEGIHAEMHHPSIVTLFSVFRTPFARYQVLEYCAEGSLETLMPHVGNDLLFEVAGGIASALAYLHEELVLHRNVCPGAILITHDKKAALGSAKGVGPQLLDLLDGLLRISPSSRIKALGTRTHPYIQHSSAAAKPVFLSANDGNPSKKSTFLQLKQSISLPPRPPSSRQPKRAVSHSNVVNTDLRSLLADELASRTTQGDGVSRRVVSDPFPRRAVVLAESTSQTETPGSSLPQKVPSRLQNPLEPCQRRITPILRPTQNAKLEATPQPPLPIGITRPLAFSTDLLAPQTHKTMHGQITILQCRSLLVDFRESRHVTHQDEWDVLIIEPDGTQINVYNMPDMSTPWKLNQPYVSYRLEDLPTAYWKQFNDAAKSYPPSHKLPATITDAVPTMRIRFNRQGRSLEIARYVDTDQGGEWLKKDLIGYKHPADISGSDYRALADTERDALDQLSDFLRKCETVENPPIGPIANENRGDGDGLLSIPAGSTMRSLSTVVQSLSGSLVPRPVKTNHQLGQRQLPVKNNFYVQPVDESLSLAPDQDTTTADSGLITLDGPNLSGFLCDTPEPSSHLQTRFIPSIGWCVRYGSRISQGGRFKIMFKDGATLDINVDEDWAEFTDPQGDKSRHGIRDCNARRKISDRFRQFEAFLSLFEN